MLVICEVVDVSFVMVVEYEASWQLLAVVPEACVKGGFVGFGLCSSAFATRLRVRLRC
jgi:hypothetical protein